MTPDGERIRTLERAARFALDELRDMSTDAFAHGADKALRIALSQALGYPSEDAYDADMDRYGKVADWR